MLQKITSESLISIDHKILEIEHHDTKAKRNIKSILTKKTFFVFCIIALLLVLNSFRTLAGVVEIQQEGTPTPISSCSGGFIAIKLTNNTASVINPSSGHNYIYFDAIMVANLVPTNGSGGTTISLNTTTLSSSSITFVTGVTPPTNHYYYQVDLGNTVFAVGDIIHVSVLVIPQCSIFGASNVYTASSYPIQITTGIGFNSYGSIIPSATGTIASSCTISTLNVVFPFLTNILNTGTSSFPFQPIGTTMTYNTSTNCEEYTFSSNSSTVYRRIRVVNNGIDLDLSAAGTFLKVHDNRVIGGIQVNSIYTSSGSLVTNAIITHTTNHDEIKLNGLALQEITGTTSTLLNGSGGGIEFWEKITTTLPTCNLTINSTIYSEYNCSGSTSYCYRSMSACSNLIFPNFNAVISGISSAIASPINTCYGSSNSNDYSLTIPNTGNGIASNTQVVLSKYLPVGSTGFTSYDFSNAYLELNGVTMSVAASAPYFTINTTAPSITIGNTSNPINIAVGNNLKIHWAAKINTPSDASCGRNVMDEWVYSGTYDGKCNGNGVFGITTGNNASYVIAPRAVGGLLGSGLGSAALIGNNTNTYNTSTGWPSTYEMYLPHFGVAPNGSTPYPTWWRGDNSITNHSIVFRFELGADLNIYQGDITNANYLSTHLYSSIRFYNKVGGNYSSIPVPSSNYCITYLSSASNTCINPIGACLGVCADDIIEVRFNLPTSEYFEDMKVQIDLEPHCSSTQNISPLDMKMYHVPNNTCSGGNTIGACTFPNNLIPLYCCHKDIVVQCPGCVITGLYTERFDVKRFTLGLVDDGGIFGGFPNDDLADGPPSQQLSIDPITFQLLPNSAFGVATDLMMYHDIFRTRTKTVVELNNGNYYPHPANLSSLPTIGTETGFEYAYTRIKFGSHFSDINHYEATSGTNQMPSVLIWLQDGTNYDSKTTYSGYTNGTPIGVYFNTADGDYVSAATNEFVYNLSMTRLRNLYVAQYGSAGGGVPPSLPFNLFHDQLKMTVDCNFRLENNIGSSTSPANVDVLTNTYLALRPETSSPSSWLIDKDNYGLLSDGTFLDNLCTDLSNHLVNYSGGSVTSPITVISNYPIGVGANTLLSDCNDIKWYCVKGESIIRLTGFSHNFLGVDYIYNSSGICNYNFQSNSLPRIFTMMGRNTFPFEYRNWSKINRIELYGLPSTITPTAIRCLTYSTGNGQVTTNASVAPLPIFSSGIWGYDFVSHTDDGIGYAIDMDNTVSPNRPKLIRSDDDATNKDDFSLQSVCSQISPFTMTLREIDEFPTNEVSGLISNQPGTTGIPAPTLGTNEKYKDIVYVITPPTPILSAVTPKSIATIGNACWTMIVQNTGTNQNASASNAWIAFSNLTGWTITSVTLNGVTMTLQNVGLNLYSAFTSFPASTSSTHITNNTIQICATYNCANPPDSISNVPIATVGYTCSPSFSSWTSVPNSTTCGNLTNPLNFTIHDPILLVNDQTNFNLLSPCGSLTLKYRIANPGFGYLTAINATLTLPLPSGITLVLGNQTTVTYAGVSTSFDLTTSSLSSHFPTIGLPGLQDLNTATTPYEMWVEIQVQSGCALSYDPANYVVMHVQGNNGCTLNSMVSKNFSYNPLLMGINSPYNFLHTAIVVPMPMNSGCSTTANIQFNFTNSMVLMQQPNSLTVPGSTVTGGYNQLIIHLPNGYTPTSITMIGYPMVTITPTINPNEYAVNIPSGIPVSNIPTITVQVTIGAIASCMGNIDGVVYTKGSFLCNGSTCNIFSAQENPTLYPTNISVPPPTLTPLIIPCSFTGSVIASGGCGNYTWGGMSGIYSTTSNTLTLNTVGSYTINATSSLLSGGVCKSVTTSLPVTISGLIATANSTNVNCFGGANGTATASISIGTPSYTYSWNSVPVQTTATATGLYAGTYTVAITDVNGCTTSPSTTIYQPAQLVVSLVSTTDVNCFSTSQGSLIDVSVVGGTVPYSFSWSNGSTTEDISNIPAGSYNVIVTDAHGCTATLSQSAVIHQRTVQTITLSLNSTKPYLCTEEIVTIFVDPILSIPNGTCAWTIDGTVVSGEVNPNLTLILATYAVGTHTIHFQSSNAPHCYEGTIIITIVNNCCTQEYSVNYTSILSYDINHDNIIDASDLGTSTKLVLADKVFVPDYSGGITISNIPVDIVNSDVVFDGNATLTFQNCDLQLVNSTLHACNICDTWQGIVIGGSVKGRISENTFIKSEIGIHILQQADNSYAPSIANNLFENCYTSILMENVINNPVLTIQPGITGNTFKVDDLCQESDKVYKGIVVVNSNWNSNISQNDFTNLMQSNNYFKGIEITNTSGIGVTNNNFKDNYRSIEINGSNNFTIENNIVDVTYLPADENLGGTPGFSFNQISVSGEQISKYGIINGNTMNNSKFYNQPDATTKNSNAAIYVDNYSNIDIKNNTINGFEDAIICQNLSNAQISENKIVNAYYNGIYLSDLTQSNISCNEIILNLGTDKEENFGLARGISYYFTTLANDPEQFARSVEIYSNCIRNTDYAIYLNNIGNNIPSPPLVQIPYIRNNFLYNYRTAGVYNYFFQNNIGFNGSFGDLGRNSFESNNYNANSYDVITEPSNYLSVDGNSSSKGILSILTNGNLNFNSVIDNRTTAACADQISGQSQWQNELLSKENCDKLDNITESIIYFEGNNSDSKLSIDWIKKLNSLPVKQRFSIANFSLGELVASNNMTDAKALYSQIGSIQGLSLDELKMIEINFDIILNQFKSAQTIINTSSFSSPYFGYLNDLNKIKIRCIENGKSIFDQKNDIAQLLNKYASNSGNELVYLDNLVNGIKGDIKFKKIFMPTVKDFQKNKLAASYDNLILFPSPTSDFVNVFYQSNKTTLKQIVITDAIGKEIKSISVKELGSLKIDVSDLASGLYILKAITLDNQILSSKFVKKKL
jgi:hypothetical protein